MNIIVNDSKWRHSDIKILFADFYGNSEEAKFVDNIPIPNLLVSLGIFGSTSKARHAGRIGNIPLGWTEYKASRKVTLWIWNPSE